MLASINDVDFDNYVSSLGSLFDYYGEDYIMEIQPLYAKSDVKAMELVSTKYLKRFYNAEIGKVKNPESNR